MTQRAVISDDYRRQQRELHERILSYGSASLGFAADVRDLMHETGAHSLSDYGAGKRNLYKGLEALGFKDFDYRPYDPAFPEYGPPRPGELVACIDVLEHIEEGYLENVLQDLCDLVERVGFFTIHTGPAQKLLDDGRNAHLIQQPASWWLPRLRRYFDIRRMEPTKGGFYVVVGRMAP